MMNTEVGYCATCHKKVEYEKRASSAFGTIGCSEGCIVYKMGHLRDFPKGALFINWKEEVK